MRRRAARSELLSTLLDSGFAWEKRNGHVYILSDREYKKATTRRERDRDALLLSGESGDRWALYEGIQDASNLSPKSLTAIQRIFFEARIQCMEEGQQYEDESGERVRIGG